MTGLVERLRSWHHLAQGDSFEALIITGMEAADRITALEAQIAAADRLVVAARRAAHATTNDGITGPIFTDEAVALQHALAAYRAAKGE